jgi:hypothetical protein
MKERRNEGTKERRKEDRKERREERRGERREERREERRNGSLALNAMVRSSWPSCVPSSFQKEGRGTQKEKEEGASITDGILE